MSEETSAEKYNDEDIEYIRADLADAIVQAALERAAKAANERDAKWMREKYEVTYAKQRYDLVAVQASENKFANILSEDIEEAIRALASDPAERAAIIKKAEEDRG